MYDESFSSDFNCQILWELPNRPDRRFYFPGANERGGSDGVILRVTPSRSEEWVGIFAFGEMSPNGITSIFTMPHPSQLCVIARGLGCIVDVEGGPRELEAISMEPVLGAVTVPARGILVIHDYLRVRAYGRDGLAWSTPSLSWDGLKIFETTDDMIRGEAWDSPRGKNVPFSIDLRTGDFKGGACSDYEQQE